MWFKYSGVHISSYTEKKEKSVYGLMISSLVRNYLSVKILEPQKWLGNAQFKKSLQM